MGHYNNKTVWYKRYSPFSPILWKSTSTSKFKWTFCFVLFCWSASRSKQLTAKTGNLTAWDLNTAWGIHSALVHQFGLLLVLVTGGSHFVIFMHAHNHSSKINEILHFLNRNNFHSHYWGKNMFVCYTITTKSSFKNLPRGLPMGP